jgi:hypothetical protein
LDIRLAVVQTPHQPMGGGPYHDACRRPARAGARYEHAYHIDFGPAAARYVDVFMEAIRCDNAARQRIASEFGFTPASRSRIAAPTSSEPTLFDDLDAESSGGRVGPDGAV